jgi:hypothetical protein
MNILEKARRDYEAKLAKTEEIDLGKVTFAFFDRALTKILHCRSAVIKPKEEGLYTDKALSIGGMMYVEVYLKHPRVIYIESIESRANYNPSQIQQDVAGWLKEGEVFFNESVFLKTALAGSRVKFIAFGEYISELKSESEEIFDQLKLGIDANKIIPCANYDLQDARIKNSSLVLAKASLDLLFSPKITVQELMPISVAKSFI